MLDKKFVENLLLASGALKEALLIAEIRNKNAAAVTDLELAQRYIAAHLRA